MTPRPGSNPLADLTRRANHGQACPAPFEKIFWFSENPNQLYNLRHPAHTEGRFAIVTDVGAGCGGRISAFDEWRVTRTAKSCGPDASTLASSLRRCPQATVTKKPDRRGEYDISRKTIARGMPGVSRCDLTNACAFYHTHCTRGYRAHRTPGIPCAL